MHITRMRHDWPEKAGFRMVRPNGYPGYTFLHFLTPVELELQGKKVLARPGACIFYTPEAPQFFYARKDIIHNWMHTDESIAPWLKEYGIPVNRVLYPKNAYFLSGLFQKIEAEFYSQHPHKDTLLQGYMQEFLICFSRALQGAQSAKIHRDDRIKFRRLRQKILSLPEENWTVPQMAAEVSLSPSRFHAVYKSLFGTSPMQDLIHAKIDYAKSLLLAKEELTLPAVAEQLGYNDQYHFIRQFKAITGQSPGAYRKGGRL